MSIFVMGEGSTLLFFFLSIQREMNVSVTVGQEESQAESEFKNTLFAGWVALDRPSQRRRAKFSAVPSVDRPLHGERPERDSLLGSASSVSF